MWDVRVPQVRTPVLCTRVGSPRPLPLSAPSAHCPSSPRPLALCLNLAVAFAQALIVLSDAHVPPTRVTAKRRRTAVAGGASQKTVSSLLFVPDEPAKLVSAGATDGTLKVSHSHAMLI